MSERARKILHIDLDAFFCAVEEQRDPSLHGKPFAVGGRPDQRGVVASCSYAARQFGVRSAMPMSRALRLCPLLLIVHHHFDLYHAASDKVMDILRNTTPLVEQISIDEAFLDVSGLPEAAEVIAHRLQAKINETLDLPCSLGVATNKLVAKIANNVGKSGAQAGMPPNAIKVVPPGQEAEFLAPLPAGDLWGIGPKTAERLAELGLHTIGDLARWPEDDLARRFGKGGVEMSLHARGIDDRPIETEHEIKSISNETTFARDVSDRETLTHTLRVLVDEVGRRLRKSGLSGTTVHIKLRWSDFTTLTRQVTLRQPIDLDSEIYAAALQLFEKNWPDGKPVRLIGVGVSGFEQPARQLGLWDAPNRPSERLQSALDELRERFGDEAIRRADDLKHDDDAG
jgi:DNA polymerase-4